jgi:hypothetical protein
MYFVRVLYVLSGVLMLWVVRGGAVFHRAVMAAP